MFKKLAQVQKDLQTLATQHGKAGFEAAKAAYFKRYTIVSDDADEAVLSVEDVEKSLDITFADEDAPASKSSDDSNALKIGEINAIIAKTVKDAIGSHNPDRSGFASQHRKAADIVVGSGYKPRYFNSAEAAYKAGQWLAATLGGSQKAAQKCRDLGIAIQRVTKSGEIIGEKGHIEGNNNLGGFLVPGEIDNEMINLLEDYGVFRRFSRYTPMTRDELSRRRLRGGPTAYPVGEAQAGTESTANWDMVKLVARKWMVLTTISSELSEDAAVSVADEFFNEAARALAQAEDNSCFYGDGTSTYNGVLGLEKKVFGLNSTVSYIQAIQVQTGTASFSGLVLSDFENTMARVQTKGWKRGVWFMNPSFYVGQANRLINAKTTTRPEIVQAGVSDQSFLGKPVVFVESMPFQWEASRAYAWFGDLALASMFGDRRQTTIAFSDSALNAFEQDETAVRVTNRWDCVIHDVGTASATASARVKGPIAGLFSAAS